MRITFLTHFPGRGGSTVLLKQLQSFLEDRGHVTSIVCGLDDESPQHETYAVVPPGGSRQQRRDRYLATIAGTRPDLVYAISGTEEFDMLRFVKVPRAHHISSLESHESVDIPRLIGQTKIFTEMFTANTPDVLETIRRWTLLPGCQFALAPYRLDPCWLASPPPTLETPRLPIHICYSARLEKFQKRAHWLAEIIALARKKDLPLRWEIIGDGPLMPALEKRLAPYREIATLHGWLAAPSMKEIYDRSDIFFLCSRWEGLPIAMAEAMTSGLACVVPKGPGGMAYAVDHEEAGWLFDASTPSDCVNALSEACSNLGRLRQKKLNSSIRARSLFSNEAVAASLVELDQKLEELTYNGHALSPLYPRRLRPVSIHRAARRKCLELVGKFLSSNEYPETR